MTGGPANADEPDIAGPEARALRAAAPAGVPTPDLLAVDPTGTGAGVPAVLMSRLPGRVDRWPSDAGRWLRRLAELQPAIHGTPLDAAGGLGTRQENVISWLREPVPPTPSDSTKHVPNAYRNGPHGH